MTKKMSDESMHRFFRQHPEAAALFILAKFDESQTKIGIGVIEGECIKPGDRAAYKKVVDAIVKNRKLEEGINPSSLIESVPAVSRRQARGVDKSCYPPVGFVPQTDPKTPGVTWLEGENLMVRLVDPAALLERFNTEQQESGESVKNSQVVNLGLGKPRILKRPQQSQLEQLLKLKLGFPSFAAVIDRVHSSLHARLLAGAATKLPNILLVGGAGAGKTTFIGKLAEILQLPFFQLASTANDPLKLTGLAPPWKGSAPGAIAKAFKQVDGDSIGNPLIFIDEIDKAGQVRGEGNTAGIYEQLLTAIEPSTGLFIDSYLGDKVPLSIGQCSWIFAANSIENIPLYFLSRTEVISIPMPDAEAYRQGLLDSIYERVLSSVPYSPFFVPMLPKEVTESLATAGKTPREVRRLLEEALEKSMSQFSVPPEQGSVWLMLQDLNLQPSQKPRRSIGFIQAEAA